MLSSAFSGAPFVSDPKKIAEIHARTRPNAEARDSSPIPEQEWDDRSLALGSRVSEFEITGIIGKGGFGIVYLAWDHSLERVVALKEYMPASFASRTNQVQVNPLSERHRETFQMGMSSFVNEAKLLAQFHSPSLVEVHRFWEANGTAYMVMPYYRGLTLGETVRSFSGPPSEAWLLNLLAPLTEALLELHSVQCYHRDVAPDNILILADTGSPLLLDFGAARRVIAGQAHALTIILKAGYAPIEQYGDVPGMQQGPWTDVYALASVVYWAVTGKTPPPATGRMIRDTYVPLAECAAAQYSRHFATAIDRALAVLPEGRTASILQLRSELGLSPLTVRGAAPTFRWADSDATVLQVSPTAASESKQATKLPQPTQVASSTAAPVRADPPPPTTTTVRDAVPGRGRPLAVGIAGAALLVATAAGVWLYQSKPAAPPELATVARSSEKAPQASTPAPAPTAPLSPTPAPVAMETIPVPQSAPDALALILAKRNPALAVSVEVDGRAAHGSAPGRSVRYTSTGSGHLYLIGTRQGSDELRLFLPGPGKAPARIDKSGKVELPVNPSIAGAWEFAFVVAREPVDLAAHGWVLDDTVWKRRFAGKVAAEKRDTLPWSIATCALEAANCQSAYGAAPFTLTIDAAPKVDIAKQAHVPPASPAPKAERTPHSARVDPERGGPKSPKPPANPECEKILMRMSLGEAGQELIDRMKSLRCN